MFMLSMVRRGERVSKWGTGSAKLSDCTYKRWCLTVMSVCGCNGVGAASLTPLMKRCRSLRMISFAPVKLVLNYS